MKIKSRLCAITWPQLHMRVPHSWANARPALAPHLHPLFCTAKRYPYEHKAHVFRRMIDVYVRVLLGNIIVTIYVYGISNHIHSNRVHDNSFRFPISMLHVAPKIEKTCNTYCSPVPTGHKYNNRNKNQIKCCWSLLNYCNGYGLRFDIQLKRIRPHYSCDIHRFPNNSFIYIHISFGV
jgi:hypothetical protein